jgi:regulator of protease activity HflC (stomatin/prohibitin superfamily)
MPKATENEDLHEERGQTVGQDVQQYEAPVGGAERARRRHEVVLLHRQHLGANEPGEVRHEHHPDGEERVDELGAEHRGDAQRQHQAGEGQDHLQPAHDRIVHRPPR